MRLVRQAIARLCKLDRVGIVVLVVAILKNKTNYHKKAKENALDKEVARNENAN